MYITTKLQQPSANHLTLVQCILPQLLAGYWDPTAQWSKGLIFVLKLDDPSRVFIENLFNLNGTLLLDLPSESVGRKPCSFHSQSLPSEYKG